MNHKICGLIPVYNNHMTIAAVIESLLQQLDFVIVVDDGSTDGSGTIAESLQTIYPERIHVLHHAHNSGKGSAVQTGLADAQRMHFTHALQVDSDGQHDLEAVAVFLQASIENPAAILLGEPSFSDDFPIVRKYGKKLTQLMIMLEMGAWDVPDAMCGFRVYPVDATCALGKMDPRMSFDPEVIIRAYWANIPLQSIPTHVRYPTKEEGGISHFKMVNDNIRNIWIHIRLLLQTPFRLLLRAMR